MIGSISHTLARRLTFCAHSQQTRSLFWRYLNSYSTEMTSPKEFVDSTIGAKKVVVFSKTWCGFCTKAKKALAKYPIKPEEYELIELDEREDGDDIVAYLKKLTGASSVPRVFIDGKFIGGGDETAKADSDGSLKKALTAANALA